MTPVFNCTTVTLAASSSSSSSAGYRADPVCELTVDSGTCSDFQDAWYFDSFSRKCHRFIYSGCGGNSNRYRTKDECELRCGKLQQPQKHQQHTGKLT